MRGRSFEVSPDQYKRLFKPADIIQTAQEVYQYVQEGHGFFEMNEHRLPEVIERVIQTTRQRYPDLNIPFHACWRHFQIGVLDRQGALEEGLQGLSERQKLKAKVDLTFVAALLGAGAGPEWQYYEPKTGHLYSRSEGLAVSTLNMFMSGLFSSDPEDPLRVDGVALVRMTKERLAQGFQSTVGNQILALEYRLRLLQNLGRVLEKSERFSGKPSRPSHLLDSLHLFEQQTVALDDLFEVICFELRSVWQTEVLVNEEGVGDVWYHDDLDLLVPFHMFAHWVTFSLIEPLVGHGIKVENMNSLAGLAEYRNGGLLIDTGLLRPKDPAGLSKPQKLSSALVVEWRALTLVYLRRIADQIRSHLGGHLSDSQIIEGGTWWAGRNLAYQVRTKGHSPIDIVSDGRNL